MRFIIPVFVNCSIQAFVFRSRYSTFIAFDEALCQDWLLVCPPFFFQAQFLSSAISLFTLFRISFCILNMPLIPLWCWRMYLLRMSCDSPCQPSSDTGRFLICFFFFNHAPLLLRIPAQIRDDGLLASEQAGSLLKDGSNFFLLISVLGLRCACSYYLLSLVSGISQWWMHKCSFLIKSFPKLTPRYLPTVLPILGFFLYSPLLSTVKGHHFTSLFIFPSSSEIWSLCKGF